MSSDIKAGDKLKLAEIAARIDVHLNRLEADKKWNRRTKGFVTSKLWGSCAFAAGNRVFITYVSYSVTASLKRADAIKYLAALDSGYKGKHWEIVNARPRELDTQS